MIATILKLINIALVIIIIYVLGLTISAYIEYCEKAREDNYILIKQLNICEEELDYWGQAKYLHSDNFNGWDIYALPKGRSK